MKDECKFGEFNEPDTGANEPLSTFEKLEIVTLPPSAHYLLDTNISGNTLLLPPRGYNARRVIRTLVKSNMIDVHGNLRVLHHILWCRPETPGFCFAAAELLLLDLSSAIYAGLSLLANC